MITAAEHNLLWQRFVTVLHINWYSKCYVFVVQSGFLDLKPNLKNVQTLKRNVIITASF